MKAEIYIDGAAKGNPGEAGIGVVIKREDGTNWKEIKRYIGHATNNVAEYQGLLLGLKEAGTLSISHVTVYSDSQLLVRQIQGTYRVKDPKLKQLFQASEELLRQFSSFDIIHVPREQNKEADALANQAIKEHIPGASK